MDLGSSLITEGLLEKAGLNPMFLLIGRLVEFESQ